MSEQIEQGLAAGEYSAVERAIFQLKSEELREYYSCCLLWHRSGSKAALSQILSSLRCFQESAKIWGLYGRLQHEEGHLNAALGGYRKAVALAPKDPVLRANFGMVLLQTGALDEAEEQYTTAVHLDDSSLESLFGLAMLYRQKGCLRDALGVLRGAESCSSSDVRYHLLMGHIYRDQGLLTEALVSYQTGLKQHPKSTELRSSLHSIALLSTTGSLHSFGGANVEQANSRQQMVTRRYLEKATADIHLMKDDNPFAIHLKSALFGGNPAQPPSDYVEQLFDGYAEDFERHLLEYLSYQVPKLVSGVLLNRFSPTNPARTVLDLGVGTGLLGPLIRTSCTTLVGVDASQKMLSLARKKVVYDELIHQDIAEFLRSSTELFHVIIAADTLVYLGDLLSFWRGVADRLADDGLCVVTLEKGEHEGYRLQHTGRYQHSEGYVEKACSAVGLVISRRGSVDLRITAGDWVPGLLLVVKKMQQS